MTQKEQMKFQPNLLKKYLWSSEQPWTLLLETQLFWKVLSAWRNEFTEEINKILSGGAATREPYG